MSACPNPLPGQGQLPHGGVAQGLIEPGLEHCQGCGIHNLPGFQCLTTLTVNNFSLLSNLSICTHFSLSCHCRCQGLRHPGAGALPAPLPSRRSLPSDGAGAAAFPRRWPPPRSAPPARGCAWPAPLRAAPGWARAGCGHGPGEGPVPAAQQRLGRGAGPRAAAPGQGAALRALPEEEGAAHRALPQRLRPAG